MTRRQVLEEGLKLTGGLALLASSFGGCAGSGGSGPTYDPQGRRTDGGPEASDYNRRRAQQQLNREAGR